VVRDLYDLDVSQEGLITEIEGGKRHHLADMGLRVGKKIRMLTRQPFRGPVVVEVGEVKISLGKGLAQKIKVEVGE
jgi:ferrous iron transport protein A